MNKIINPVGLISEMPYSDYETNYAITKPNSRPLPSPGGVPAGGVAKRASNSANAVPNEIITINNVPVRRNFVEYLPYNPFLTRFVKEKRKAGILSEVLFWQQVHRGSFHKIDFDRQPIIGNYIVDFYVKRLGLVIEIDGSSHDNKQDYDNKRQRYLEELGLRVYRITDFDVKNNLDIVMMDLEKYIVKEYGIVNWSPRLSATSPWRGIRTMILRT